MNAMYAICCILHAYVSHELIFMGQETLDKNKQAGEDGYISDDDNVAVLYDMTPKGPKKQRSVYEVFFGNLAKVTYEKGGKQVPGPRAHLLETSGEAVCKWFDPIMELNTNRSPMHVSYNGKKAYHLRIDNPTGFNDKVEFGTILTVVRMTLDTAHDCWLLDNADFDYAERQRARWDQYHNATEAAHKRKGPFQKDVRKDHDKLKTKVSDHIKLVVQMLH